MSDDDSPKTLLPFTFASFDSGPQAALLTPKGKGKTPKSKASAKSPGRRGKQAAPVEAVSRLGIEGRKTGFRPKENLRRDSTNMANVDDFFEDDKEASPITAQVDVPLASEPLSPIEPASSPPVMDYGGYDEPAAAAPPAPTPSPVREDPAPKRGRKLTLPEDPPAKAPEPSPKKSAPKVKTAPKAKPAPKPKPAAKSKVVDDAKKPRAPAKRKAPTAKETESTPKRGRKRAASVDSESDEKPQQPSASDSESETSDVDDASTPTPAKAAPITQQKRPAGKAKPAKEAVMDELESLNDAADRVSKRGRKLMAPLAYWRTEKVVYNRRQSGILPDITAVIRRPEASPPPPKKRAPTARAKRPRERSPNPEIPIDNEAEAKVVTPSSKAPKTVSVYKSAASLDYVTLDQGPVTAATAFDTQQFMAGMLNLPSGATTAASAASTTQIFVVQSGSATVTLEKQSFSCGKGGLFYVPARNKYIIANPTSTDCSLACIAVKD
eukprot:TRINITY_DN6013_c0_g1_i1.p1 TRINITY_DN6013_c0_g1~~TRINITY_DN6013_c0_g1_i1.p1  ORF type:complete len:496 (+),score=105.38 TRINITY_DN6013_c0_g1_i1:80-1567(+)